MSIFSFFTSLFSSDSDESKSGAAKSLVSTCPRCASALSDCRCCYQCGSLERIGCACSVALADAALRELATDIEREDSL